MKIVCVDIETTGLNPDNCQIIEIAGVIMDTNKFHGVWPRFVSLIHHDVIVGEPYALAMHSVLLRRIADGEGAKINTALQMFSNWIQDNLGDAKFTVAGKNFGGFDQMFLREFPEWNKLNMSHRFFDIGNLYWLPWVDGEQLPSSAVVKERSGLEGPVSHTALEDALDCALQLQKHIIASYKL